MFRNCIQFNKNIFSLKELFISLTFRYLKEIEDEKNKYSGKSEGLKDNNNSSDSTSCSTGSSLISSSDMPTSNFKINPFNNSGNIKSNTDNVIKLPLTTTVPLSSTSTSPQVILNSSTVTTSPSTTLFSTFKMDNTNKSGGSSLLSKPDPASLMINPFTSSTKKPQDEDKGAENANKNSETLFKLPQDNTSSGFSFGR